MDAPSKSKAVAIVKAEDLIASYTDECRIDPKMASVNLRKSINHYKSTVDLNSAEKDEFDLNLVKNQAIALMILGAFPWFVASKAYQDWCESELRSNVTCEGREDRLDELFSLKEDATEETISLAMASVDAKEIDRLLASGSWLDSLLAAVEDLPICVSLSTADISRKGFPLIYVNKAFESTTGYMRSEITGQNCRFLQTGEICEQDVIDKLSAALSSAVPVKVAITNYRKDGSTFLNLLAMKPIFDTRGKYRFVIGVQFDVTSEGDKITKINLIDDLLSILPNVVFCEDEV